MILGIIYCEWDRKYELMIVYMVKGSINQIYQ